MRPLRLALLASAPLLVALPAVAQWFDGPRGYYNAPPPPYGYGYGYGAPVPRVLSRDRIVERLEDLGFDDVGRPRLDGDVYTVTAIDPSGRRIRVAVDAYRGTVLRRVGLGAPDWVDDGDDGPRRRPGPSPYDEMPGAPRFRDPPDAIARVEPAPSATPRLAPAAPIESRPLAPPSSGRALPADPRLAPNAAAPRPAEPRPTESGPAEPRSEASRPDATPPAAAGSRPGASPSGTPYGTNPEGGRSTASRPANAARPAAKPPVAATSPAAPAPSAVGPKPAENAPAAATAEGPRKPVRVIQGVTPLNSGGAQASPAPQNNEAATPNP